MGLYVLLFILLLIAIIFFLLLGRGERRDIPFIGLAPLLGPLKQSRQYLNTLISKDELEASDEEGESRVRVKPIPIVSPVPILSPIPTSLPLPDLKDKITEPGSWNFTDIKGEKKRERITRRILETLYSAPFPTVRPEWIINPRTGRRLEIDCYNQELGLAVEVSGEQHYIQSAKFHRNRGEFLSQVYRDKVKKEAILARGLDFIVVPYTIPTLDIPSYVMEMLRKLGRA